MNSCLNSIISVLFCSVTYTNSLLFMTLFYSLSHGFQLVRSRFKSNLLKIQCLNKITAVCIRTCQYLLWVLQQLHCNSASFNLNTNYCSAYYKSCFYLTVLNTSKKKNAIWMTHNPDEHRLLIQTAVMNHLVCDEVYEADY